MGKIMDDIIFLIRDYLEQLRERDELDAILPDLLRAMGYSIVKLAFQGEVENGIDIAAYASRKNGGDLLLIQVKAGDIDQALWDSGPNSIRATLNNILDVPFQDLSLPKLRDADKKVILAHNGVLRENVRNKFNGYIENKFIPYMEFERWDIDTLANLFYKYLFSERLLPKGYQRLLKRLIVFLEVKEYDFQDYKVLLNDLLSSSDSSTAKRKKIFRFLGIILAIISKQSSENNNYSKILEIHEYTLLIVWEWLAKNNYLTSSTISLYSELFSKYYLYLLQWSTKLSPVARIEFGFLMGGYLKLSNIQSEFSR
jgi:hypothetical protein